MMPTHAAPAPFSTLSHPGTYQACADDLCTSHRHAIAILREDQPLSPAEQAAAAAIRDAKWVLWHAEDRDLAVALILSRADLLRDRAHEDHLGRGATVNAAAVERRRRADGQAITRFEELTTLAADLLDSGTSPAAVAAQLRDLSAEISARRERATAA